METDNILKLIYKALDDKKGYNIKIIDVSGISVMMDYLVICTGGNINQIQALCDSVEDSLSSIGVHRNHIEGGRGGNWILLDYNNILINIFDKEARGYYDLDHIWADGRVVEM